MPQPPDHPLFLGSQLPPAIGPHSVPDPFQHLNRLGRRARAARSAHTQSRAGDAPANRAGWMVEPDARGRRSGAGAD
jgi:hypothetical protein